MQTFLLPNLHLSTEQKRNCKACRTQAVVVPPRHRTGTVGGWPGALQPAPPLPASLPAELAYLLPARTCLPESPAAAGGGAPPPGTEGSARSWAKAQIQNGPASSREPLSGARELASAPLCPRPSYPAMALSEVRGGDAAESSRDECGYHR